MITFTAKSLEQTISGQLHDLLKSQKVQIWLVAIVLQVLSIVAGVLAKRWGMDPAAAQSILEKVLLGLNVAPAVLTGAHAYVDGKATSAAIAADQGLPPQQLVEAAVKAAVAETRLQLTTELRRPSPYAALGQNPS